MKNLVLVIVFVCCFSLGFLIKKKYFSKKIFYEKLCFFIKNLINNISYNNEKLNIFVESEIDKSTNELKKLLVLFLKVLKGQLSKEDFLIENKKNLYFLTDYELKETVNFLLNIGTKTKEEEIEFLNNNFLIFNEKHINAMDKYNKYANLYFKLFIVLGIGVLIIFV